MLLFSYEDIAKARSTACMAVFTGSQEHRFHSSRELTALYLAQFKYLLAQQSAEIEQLRQNHYSLARHFYAQAQSRHIQHTLSPKPDDVLQLLVDSMRTHKRGESLEQLEQAVLTMQIAQSIVELVLGVLDITVQPGYIRDFLEESGILELQNQNRLRGTDAQSRAIMIPPPTLVVDQTAVAAQRYRLR